MTLASLPQTLVKAQAGNDISFTPNSIPDVNVYYQDYSFVFEYKTYFIRVRPFVIYNETYYGMSQIVSWIKNNYPNIDYKWLVSKAVNAIHYGFNLTKLPQNVADKVDYLGFRLVDFNFPLSWFELRRQRPHIFINLPKANLQFSFEDLYPYGYSISAVNSSYVLVGNVKGKTDLILDPIVQSGNLMIMTGYSEGSEGNIWDFWNASNSNGWNIAFQNQFGYQYAFNCSLQWGDGENATWFKDVDVQVLFFNSTVNPVMRAKNNSHVTLGNLVDATNKITSQPVSIKTALSSGLGFLWTDDGSETYIYGGELSSVMGFSTGDIDLEGEVGIYNSRVVRVNQIIVRSQNIDFYNIELSNTTYAGFGFDESATFEKLTVTDTSDALLYFECGSSNFIIQDFYGRNASTPYSIGVWDTNYPVYLINPDLDQWTFDWSNPTNVFRQYIFDLTIYFQNGSYAQGANVTISNDYSGTSDSWLISSNGSIPQQTYSYGHYNQTRGNTIYDYNPYNLTVTLDGYETYTDLINITQKEDLRIALTTTMDGAISFDSTYYLLGVVTFLPLLLLILKRRRKNGS